MINNIKQYFLSLLNDAANEGTPHKTIELATAALLIEISLADDHIDAEERHTIKTVLREHYNLTDEEIDALISLAENEVNHAVSLYEFTRLLNDKLSMPEKINIIQSLWHVAYADSVLDKYEEYYIRKIADLLYISHSDYIQSKIIAAE
jgi:uncharacterized tellurite resistance protein B-like protein